MTCQVGNANLADGADSRRTPDEEIFFVSRLVGDGVRQIELSVPAASCGGCMQKIERALMALPRVVTARVNLSTRRVTVRWRDGGSTPTFISTLAAIGYDAHLLDAGSSENDPILRRLVKALAVSGFAASNIMMLSVSVWSGATPSTRDLFHWISALIALPVLAYSGQVFFRSAWDAVRRGQTNMDVPISIGVLLAFGLSLYETLHHGPHAYFDAAVSLLFFLLVGRTLDHLMRERARTAVRDLARLSPRGALVAGPDGSRAFVSLDAIECGMRILLAAGERIPVDSRIVGGTSELDCSLVSGESVPQPAAPGAEVRAGMLNLTGPLTLVATASAKDSLLAEMLRMMEAAEAGRTAHRRIADRAASLYAPIVHLTAFATFLGWMASSGDVRLSLTVAIATLIITCPCALGLAAPMVQVVAAKRLFENGIMLKDGGALERLAEVDCVVFDKTGTLTMGEPMIAQSECIDPAALAIAGSMASHSKHPYSRALASAALSGGLPMRAVVDFSEEPGSGIEARIGDLTYRLGRPEWALQQPEPLSSMPQVVLAQDGQQKAGFDFVEHLRPGARKAIMALARDGINAQILSGDREEPVRRLATLVGVSYQSEFGPGEKAAHIAALAKSGRKPLMVGDGLNDAPALGAAHASMAPASAADVGRNAADLVFLHDDLCAIPFAVQAARETAKLVRQNFALAVIYNVMAIPIAILGYVTPLIAALAMSMSSIIVVANALRLNIRSKTEGRDIISEGAPHPAPLVGAKIA